MGRRKDLKKVDKPKTPRRREKLKEYRRKHCRPDGEFQDGEYVGEEYYVNEVNEYNEEE